MTTTLTNDDLVARRIPLKGTFNLRDVGGFATTDGRSIKWRTLLRSDALHLVDEDGKAELTDIGLRSVLDLREGDEKNSAPSQLPETVSLVEIPLFTFAVNGEIASAIDRETLQSLPQVYRLLIETRGPALVAVVRELSQPNTLPAIVHCTAGKDRTGIVIALVLSALGVSDDVIASDYSATSMFLGEAFREAMQARNAMPGYDDERMAKMLECKPEFILEVLEVIREVHGDVESYLLHHGLSKEDLASLRDSLLEDEAIIG